MTHPSHIALRPAGPDDLALLRHWDQQPHVIESDPDSDWGWETELARSPPWREQLIAEIDGRPLGFVQIIDPVQEESHYWGDVPAGLRAIDIWIGEATDLGRGYGSVMMRLAIERCFAAGDVEGILIDPLASNVRAHAFYRRFGFRFIERRWFGGDDCFVFRLDRSEYQRGRGRTEEG
ncbi:MAG: acetyltransferase [Gammaproteobacteria bacterium]|nr:acetyltransferase [Gammaproteobacteria bacterium]